MWPFVDPIECRQAELCLAHGQPLEAARILLAARYHVHDSRWCFDLRPQLSGCRLCQAR